MMLKLAVPILVGLVWSVAGGKQGRTQRTIDEIVSKLRYELTCDPRSDQFTNDAIEDATQSILSCFHDCDLTELSGDFAVIKADDDGYDLFKSVVKAVEKNVSNELTGDCDGGAHCDWRVLRTAHGYRCKIEKLLKQLKREKKREEKGGNVTEKALDRFTRKIENKALTRVCTKNVHKLLLDVSHALDIVTLNATDWAHLSIADGNGHNGRTWWSNCTAEVEQADALLTTILEAVGIAGDEEDEDTGDEEDGTVLSGLKKCKKHQEGLQDLLAELQPVDAASAGAA